MNVPAEVRHRFRELVALRLGLAFPEARQADMERGLVGASRSSPFPTPEAYVGWLGTLSDQSPEWRRLAGYLTVGETYFFRDRGLFEALEQQVLPSLIAARRAAGLLRLRLWSAGCATGEEPYSLAILLDRLLPDRSKWALTILATDINPNALRVARQGIYRKWSFRDTPEWARTRFFRRLDSETVEVVQDIRDTVVFAPLNLHDRGYPSVVTNTVAMDLIVCRNVLMYFTPEAQRAASARLREALGLGGWLVVSPVEASAELVRSLVPVRCPGGTLYCRSDDAPQPRAISPAAAVAVKPTPPAVPPTGPHAKPRADAASLLGRARALADEGRLDDARRDCELALECDRLDPGAHLLLAAICQERGDLEPALNALRRAIYLDPDLAPAHFLLGSLLFRQGDRRRGRRFLETAAALLRERPRDEVVPGADGLSAGPLLDMVREHLELG